MANEFLSVSPANFRFFSTKFNTIPPCPIFRVLLNLIRQFRSVADQKHSRWSGGCFARR